jgi:lactoylglutathione lyase
MAFRINHIHLKASDPRRTADWYVKAFNFKILSDETRAFGDRFVRCMSEDGGIAVNISGARTGERLGGGDAMPHHGLEHFGFDSANLEADIARLEKLGCPLLEGPIQVPNGPRIAFMRAPDDTRIELIELPKKPAVAGGCC